MNEITRCIKYLDQLVLLIVLIICISPSAMAEKKLRVRNLGIIIGIMEPGPLNMITDVHGVKVGHVTLNRGNNIHTGVTAIIPHSGNLLKDKVPGAVFIGNGFGKLIGSTQVNELGEIETPILLTSTLSAPKVADALISYLLNSKDNENVLSINPLVGETNDGYLNDIRSRAVSQNEVFEAINSAKEGVVQEGNVGAGTGTVAFGYKGGIGTASRRIPIDLGGYTVGVLVQSNFGGELQIAGIPMTGISSQKHSSNTKNEKLASMLEKSNGSIMIIVATDAPLDHRNLYRLAARAMMGLARTGSNESNGSGDYVIAFSTAKAVRISGSSRLYTSKLIKNENMTPLFEAAIEATEEAIYNSMFTAEDMIGNGHTIRSLPVKKVLKILKRHHVVN